MTDDIRPVSPRIPGTSPVAGNVGAAPQADGCIWLACHEGRQSQALTLAQLQVIVRARAYPPGTLFWRPGMREWLPPESIPELSVPVPGASDAPSAPEDCEGVMWGDGPEPSDGTPRISYLQKVVTLPGGVLLGMARIQPGSFVMGSAEEEEGSARWESPSTHVTLTTGFWCGQTSITQEQFLAVTGKNPSWFKGTPDLPVECVSWDDAVDFCEKLSRLTGSAFRLPTEAEWEYACRAGTTTPFSFGGIDGDPSGHVWYDANSGARTHPVHEGLPNAWGLWNMHGNVWNWCLDWFGAYHGGSAVDPVGPPTGTNRVFRGGGWGSALRMCRSAFRFRSRPSYRLNSIGFRVIQVT